MDEDRNLNKFKQCPIGVTPYWIEAGNRIVDLSEAIIRYSENVKKNYRYIRKWAEEIVQQCDLVEYLNI